MHIDYMDHNIFMEVRKKLVICGSWGSTIWIIRSSGLAARTFTYCVSSPYKYILVCVCVCIYTYDFY